MIICLIKQNKQHLYSIFSYGVFGSIGMLIDVLFFNYLCNIGINYLMANLIGYAAGTLVSFILNRRYTFRINDKIFQRIILFYVAASIGCAISTFLLYVFVARMGMKPLSGKMLTLIFVFFTQYCFNKFITFCVKIRSMPKNEQTL